MKAGQLHPFVLRVNSSLEHADMGNVATSLLSVRLSPDFLNMENFQRKIAKNNINYENGSEMLFEEVNLE